MRRFFSCTCLLFLLTIATLTHAQVANNTALVGTVVDPDGHALAGAKVNAVEESTKVAYPGATNAEGNY